MGSLKLIHLTLINCLDRLIQASFSLPVDTFAQEPEYRVNLHLVKSVQEITNKLEALAISLQGEKLRQIKNVISDENNTINCKI